MDGIDIFFEDEVKREEPKRKFSLDEILSVEKKEEEVVGTLVSAELINSTIYYTNKDELLERMQNHSIDIVITDNPEIHNLRLLDELLNLKATIIVFDIAGYIDDEKRSNVYSKSESFLSRHKYELYREGVIKGFKTYEWRRGNETKLTDICVEEIPAESVAMIMVASFSSNDIILLDTYALPEFIYYGELYKKNLISIVEFKQDLITYIENFLLSKENTEQEKVEPKTGQYTLVL